MIDQDRAERFIGTDDDIVLTLPPDEVDADQIDLALSNRSIDEQDANEYWQHFPELQADMGTTWLDYQAALTPAVLQALDAGQALDDGFASAFHVPLLSAWVGTEAEPGALTKLIIAGMKAGQVMLERGKALKPGATRAIEIAVDWALESTQALDHARSYAYGLIKGLDDTTRAAIGDVMARVIAEGLTVEARNGLLADVLIADGATPSERVAARAQLIGQTESVRAFTEGSIKRYQDVNIREGTWQTVNDGKICPQCRSVHAVRATLTTGWYSAVDGLTVRPPRHPGCRCFIRPYVE